MQIKRITCPNCKVVLDVKNSQNETEKQITCPACKTLLKVRFQPQQEPIEAKTYYAPPKKQTLDYEETQLVGSNNDETLLASSPTPKTKQTVKLMFGGVSYPLEEGQNIVGRKGSTSKATIQIDTADRYMSRQHCSITVTTMPDGTRKAVLSNYQNKNLTAIDEQAIDTGDSIRLRDGNTITMGHTTVTFKLS